MVRFYVWSYLQDKIRDSILQENDELTEDFKSKIEDFRFSGGVFQKLYVVKEDSPLDKMLELHRLFGAKMFEDKVGGPYSYEEFYQKIVKTAKSKD